jgi:hypothetical protein
MPAPVKAQLKPIVVALFASKKFTGRNANDLADIIGDAIAQSLSIFVAQAKVAPGIPVVAPAPALSGSTVGTGNIIFQPQKAVFVHIVKSLFSAKKFTGKNINDLADIIGDAIAQSLSMFAAQVKVAPGIPIAGGVTTAAGLLV